MAERLSASKRFELSNAAEREILRYKGQHALWHKHVHNVELDPVQLLKMEEMDLHDYTIDFSVRRGGKTAVKELHGLEYNACNEDQETGIVAPRLAQSVKNITYHTDAIRRSEILSSYISHKSGRRQLSDSKYEFANRSRAEAHGIMADVDGGDLTMASLEEVDDMPKDRLYSRFLLMLGSTRRLGASKDSINDPKIRITGVFKGADTLTDLLNTGEYFSIGCFHGDRAKEELKRLISLGELEEEAVEINNYKYPLPILNLPNALELGLVNGSVIDVIKADLSQDEVHRQLLGVNTASRNLVWEKYMQRSRQVGLDSKLELGEPMPGQTYRKRGLISFGYDHLGHGEQIESSKSAFVALEQLGNFVVPLFAKTWAPGTDEIIIKNDLKGFWRYFTPDAAIGDAYGIGLLTTINDELYREGLTTINRLTIGDGTSTATNWTGWAFAPLRFDGPVKHSMAQAVRSCFHNCQSAIPYFDDDHPKDAVEEAMLLMCRQIVNIKPVNSKNSYSIYKMADSKLGDDLFDAYMAALWALINRGAIDVSTVILTATKTREQMLPGSGNIILPSEA